MTRNKVLALLAAMLCWWPLPLGIGYLFVGKWPYTILAIILQSLGATAVRLVAGTEVRNVYLAVLAVAVFIHILRLARARWRLEP